MSLAVLLGIVLSGLIVGSLARFAVPGPDPMPIWKTILFGVGGSLIGGGIGYSVGEELGGFLGSVIVATVLIIVYRRFVQKRPITGPEANRNPTRRGGPTEELRRLGELRESGVLTPDEFEAKKAELLARM